MSVTTLRRPATPPRDRTAAARATLAEKIAEHESIKSEMATIDRLLGDGGEFCYDAIFAARQRADCAREVVAEIERTAADRLIRAAMGQADPDAKDLKTARGELQEAEAHETALRDARKKLEAKLESMREPLKFAAWAVEAGANAVLREHVAPEVDTLIAKLNATYIEAGQLSILFEWLCGRAINDRGPDAHPGASDTSYRFTSPPCSWVENKRENSALRGKWIAAHAALLADASAPLPGFD